MFVSIGHRGMCDSVLEHTWGGSEVPNMKYERWVRHTHPRAPSHLLTGCYLGLKHGGEVAASEDSIAPLSSQHSIANWQEEICSQKNHKNFKTCSDDLAWPNHFTVEHPSYKVVLSFASGHTKSKCWAKTSGDFSHVTLHTQLGLA